MIYPIDFLYVANLKLSKFPVFISKSVAFLLKVYYKIRYYRNYRDKESSRILKGSYKDIMHFIQEYRKKIELPHIQHNSEWLHWRCGSLEPYRKETKALYTPSGSFILYYPGSKYCNICEYSFSNPKEQKFFLRELLKIATEIPAKALYVYVNESDDEKYFKRFGFLGFRNKVKVYAYTKDSDIDLGSRFYMNTYDSDGNI
jgi:hypothetical protein